MAHQLGARVVNNMALGVEGGPKKLDVLKVRRVVSMILSSNATFASVLAQAARVPAPHGRGSGPFHLNLRKAPRKAALASFVLPLQTSAAAVDVAAKALNGTPMAVAGSREPLLLRVTVDPSLGPGHRLFDSPASPLRKALAAPGAQHTTVRMIGVPGGACTTLTQYLQATLAPASMAVDAISDISVTSRGTVHEATAVVSLTFSSSDALAAALRTLAGHVIFLSPTSKEPIRYRLKLGAVPSVDKPSPSPAVPDPASNLGVFEQQVPAAPGPTTTRSASPESDPSIHSNHNSGSDHNVLPDAVTASASASDAGALAHTHGASDATAPGTVPPSRSPSSVPSREFVRSKSLSRSLVPALLPSHSSSPALLVAPAPMPSALATTLATVYANRATVRAGDAVFAPSPHSSRRKNPDVPRSGSGATRAPTSTSSSTPAAAQPPVSTITRFFGATTRSPVHPIVRRMASPHNTPAAGEEEAAQPSPPSSARKNLDGTLRAAASTAADADADDDDMADVSFHELSKVLNLAVSETEGRAKVDAPEPPRPAPSARLASVWLSSRTSASPTPLNSSPAEMSRTRSSSAGTAECRSALGSSQGEPAAGSARTKIFELLGRIRTNLSRGAESSPPGSPAASAKLAQPPPTVVAATTASAATITPRVSVSSSAVAVAAEPEAAAPDTGIDDPSFTASLLQLFEDYEANAPASVTAAQNPAPHTAQAPPIALAVSSEERPETQAEPVASSPAVPLATASTKRTCKRKLSDIDPELASLLLTGACLSPPGWDAGPSGAGMLTPNQSALGGEPGQPTSESGLGLPPLSASASTTASKRQRLEPEVVIFSEQRRARRTAFGEEQLRNQRRYLRYKVIRIREELDKTVHPNPSGNFRVLERVLTLLDETTHDVKTAVLRGQWMECMVAVDCVVHVVGSFSRSERVIVIDNESNFLIVLPDELVSGTQVSGSFYCMRQKVLDSRISSLAGASSAMLFGSLIHELFQTALGANCFETAFLEATVAKLVASNLSELYFVDEDETTAHQALWEIVPLMRAWVAKHLAKPGGGGAPRGKVPPDEAVPFDARGDAGVRVTKLLDIEENVWSPMFGLKGKVDVSLEAELSFADGTIETMVMPLELKSGKLRGSQYSSDHRAQVLLYTLLMADKYAVEVSSALLYYTKAGKLFGVPVRRGEIQSLVIQRNNLAVFMAERNSRPPMLRSTRTCSRCSQLATCTLYHAAVEGGNAETSGLGEVWDSAVAHLPTAHLDYFALCEKMLALEEGTDTSSNAEIWTMSGPARERKGTAISFLVVRSVTVAGSNYLYTFEEWRHKAEHMPSPHQSTSGGSGVPLSPYATRARVVDGLLASTLKEGDYVALSTEYGHIAVETGFVHELTPETITLKLDRELRVAHLDAGGTTGAPAPPPPVPRSSQAYPFASADDKSSLPSPPSFQCRYELQTGRDYASQQVASATLPILYRVDKAELGLNTTRLALVSAMSQASTDCHLRELVIDLKPPRFGDRVTARAAIAPHVLDGLNDDQQSALATVMAAKDYSLILGMPGTGKTTTIARAVQALVSVGKRVVIASYTHLAVDNILLKLAEAGVHFLRLGSSRKVHADLQDYTERVQIGRCGSVKEVQNMYESVAVVGCTCLAFKNKLFSKQQFDVCIVDEASQITQPGVLGILRVASSFVLVGDHNQLPPLVRSEEAAELGLRTSMFKRLSEAHPAAVAVLTKQYRMNASIMLLANTLIYEQQLECGTSQVARGRLKLPHFPTALARPASRGLSAAEVQDVLMSQGPAALSQHSSASAQTATGRSWLAAAVDPAAPVVFLNTDGCPAPDTNDGKAVRNHVEAELVHLVARGLLACGLDPGDLGVISPYHAQLKVIRRYLAPVSPRVEVHTVDRYQGRDKECIIFSCVRSNTNGTIGRLLADSARINVALTRAKKKTVLIGSLSTLSSSPLFASLFALLRTHSWVVDLGRDAHRLFHEWIPVSSSPHAGLHSGVEDDHDDGSSGVHGPSIETEPMILVDATEDGE
ncbi:uncharacterized protein AMSG_11895 [Thecamonas trahens ATCC 50062]|uniref:DNA replication ATP-dependent helicase/nuclease DNA2 n=1 Tax=Thecamonas trahens ATCC 50062 TaxID=461836 RepID=A0A0L0DC16_THETB|nr:hypothetical protein AMSG_11895 [Thecamonas trahens ATCC 50062]KNC49616.1 hypothetical protein AMSG_11895 [Thecamonas trahens ATCC 50062]|eukprot:XP_013757769.1 hypothetical protein AMSG_11895 [Thecamonas trahens ATCC 50062]